MITIKEAISTALEGERSKYALAKRLNTGGIMIDKYLTGDVKSPQIRICKTIYEEFGMVVFPYTEDELKC